MAAADRLKLSLAVLMMALGIGAYYYLGAQALWVRYLILLAAIVLAIVAAGYSATGKAAWGFVKEARVELRKVVWPTRKETLQMTLVVIVMVIFIAAFLGLVDWVLIRVVEVITGQRA